MKTKLFSLDSSLHWIRLENQTNMYAVFRLQQISDVQARYPQLRCIDNENSAFLLPLQLKNGKNGFLRIDLPHRFPSDSPLITLTQQVEHPWVDDFGTCFILLIYYISISETHYIILK